MQAGKFGMLLIGLAFGSAPALASPCGSLNQPCEALTPDRIIVIGRVISEKLYSGEPLPVFTEGLPLKTYLVQVSEVLYGEVPSGGEIEVFGGLLVPYTRGGMFWLKKLRPNKIVYDPLPNCIRVSPGFFTRLEQFLRQANQQGPPKGNLNVSVDSGRRRIPRALVKIYGPEQRQELTGEDGIVEFKNLTPGTYLLDAVAPGFLRDQRRVWTEVIPWTCQPVHPQVPMYAESVKFKGRVANLALSKYTSVGVRLQRIDLPSPHSNESGVNEKTNGEFIVDGRGPGLYRVELRPRFSFGGLGIPMPEETSYVALSHDRNTYMELPVGTRKPIKVTFQFLAPDQRPLSYQQIHWISCQAHPRSEALLAATLDSLGRFTTELPEYAQYPTCWRTSGFVSKEPRNIVLGPATQDASIQFQVQFGEAEKIP